jgi:hypothetical protein
VIKEFLMADTDLSTKFEKISDKAKTALDQLRAASQRTRDQLAAEAASARDQATAAANQFKHKGDFACDRASSQWREIRGKWQIHVAKARASVHRDRGRFNAREAARSADMAHAYALMPSISRRPQSRRPSPRHSTRCHCGPTRTPAAAGRGSDRRGGIASAGRGVLVSSTIELVSLRGDLMNPRSQRTVKLVGLT